MTEPAEVAIDVEPTDDEIKQYVEHDLAKELEFGKRPGRDRRTTSSQRGTTRLGRLCQAAPELRTMIPQYIVASSNGMFMLAKLFMNAVKAKNTPEEVKLALENLPQGYDESYKAAMERIEAVSQVNPYDTSSSLAKRTLMWVVCSHRPLSLAELQEALTIDVERPDFRTSYTQDKETLLEVTAGLLYIDSDDKAVRLCHATAHEYFDESKDTWFPGYESQIAQCCLQFLNRPEFAKPVQDIGEDVETQEHTKEHPILEYAYAFWGEHAADAGYDDKVQEMAIKYLDDLGRVDSWAQAAWLLTSAGLEGWDVREGATGLHVAAWFGLTYVIQHLLEQGLNINHQDLDNGQTPLIFACRRGNSAALSLLLQRGASVNLRSRSGSTALFEAVVSNHVEVVAILLKDPNLKVNNRHPQNAERSPLMFAARDNSGEILGELLGDVRIDVNQKDLYGVTALTIAVKANHLLSVECLLGHASIEIDTVDETGSTALIHAVKRGFGDIVDRLLESGADPARKDQEGGNALLRAIDNGQTSIVQRLLEYHDANTLIAKSGGNTLLHAAAFNGYLEIIQILLNRGLDKNSQDSNGKNPLHEASRGGHAAIVRLLLDASANPSLKDKYSRTPRDIAWTNIHPEIILLLDHKPTDDLPVSTLLSNYPNTNLLPIWSLAKLGNVDILSSALTSWPPSDFSQVDPDTGNNALHTAVLFNHPHILSLLLQPPLNISPNSLNHQLRTPLHLACLTNSLPCTILLLPFCSDIIDNEDIYHQTPLLIAQIKTHVEIALMLIEKGARIEGGRVQVDGLLALAVEEGNAGAVRRLLEVGGRVNGRVEEILKRARVENRLSREVGMKGEGGTMSESALDYEGVLRVLKEAAARKGNTDLLHVGKEEAVVPSYVRKGSANCTLQEGEEEDQGFRNGDTQDSSEPWDMAAFSSQGIFDQDHEDRTEVGGIEGIMDEDGEVKKMAVAVAAS
ncbi:MAG: hypothetical protein Q9220_002264 [cf. Caloplaca sp. 1 TL-2023]